jgi:hypothetical protein
VARSGSRYFFRITVHGSHLACRVVN